MLMTPALALFYGGLVRRKHVLSILMQCMFILALVSVTWVLVGYTLAFGQDVNGWGIIGNLDHIGLKGIGAAPGPYAPTIPAAAFALFQMMFAIITPALIIGAFAERKRFKAFVLFALMWSLLVYSPICHWVWGEGGWLRNMGVLDYAGGTVVHISSGVAALVAASAHASGASPIGLRRTMSASRSSAQASCGSAGSGSTAVRPAAPTSMRSTRCWSPTPPPAWARLRG